MSLTAITARLSGISLKGNGNVLTVGTEALNNVVLSVDTQGIRTNVNGELSATTLKGKSIRTSQVSSATPTVISLDTDLTVFTNAGVTTSTLANGINGQVKYLGKTTAANMQVQPVNLVGGGTVINMNDVGDGITLIYNAAAPGWVIVGNNGAAVA